MRTAAVETTKGMHMYTPRPALRLGVCGLVMMALVCGIAIADTFSPLLSFQGRLAASDGKPLPDGPYTVRFTVYDAAAGGATLWQESQSVTQVGGTFTAILGSTTSFPTNLFTGGNRWLGIKVGSDPEMTQRIRFTASPWAIFATTAGTDNDWSFVGSDIYRLGGNVGIGKNSPSTALDVAGTIKTTGFQLTTGATNNYVLVSDAAGIGTWKTPPAANAWTLTGNAGTTPPSSFLGTTDMQPLVFKTNGLERLRLDTAGNVGIGVTSPDYPLHVVGNGLRTLYSVSSAVGGTALYGDATSASGVSFGVYGKAASSVGRGVFGITSSALGTGVAGQNGDYWGSLGSPSAGAHGEYGEFKGELGKSDCGVEGTNGSNTGDLGNGYAAVDGTANSGYGVRGISYNSWGVLGMNPSGSSKAGVVGAIQTSGGGTLWVSNSGVSGGCENGYGVAGRSITGTGVYGVQDSTGNSGSLGTLSEGVYGATSRPSTNAIRGVNSSASDDTPAISGTHNVTDFYGIGVRGIGGYKGVSGEVAASGSQAYEGVQGYAHGGSGTNYGVYGYATGGATSIAVYGTASGASSGNFAGFFAGNVTVTGTLTKGGGSFKIDHPLDPENKYLSHSFVESPDMKNIYDGTVTTDDRGYATVTLPDWFDALNRDFRYQLTVLDDSDSADFVQAKVVRKIADNTFVIRTSAPKVEVSWQVTGIRQDAYANLHRIPVEEDKPANERGKYLHPDAYGKPMDEGIGVIKQPDLGKR